MNSFNKIRTYVLFLSLSCISAFTACDRPASANDVNETSVINTETVEVRGDNDAVVETESLDISDFYSETEDLSEPETFTTSSSQTTNIPFNYESLSEYSGTPYVFVNDGQPYFTDAELTTDEFEEYGDLDELGRCTVCFANVSPASMPTEKRGDISSVYPTGWMQAEYDIVNNKYLYNRAHLIGFQLCAENANKKNLITGTRYFNVDGMLPFENMVADYVKETGNHVAYRVTPVFVNDELVARGVLMEAESVEDYGEGVGYCVFVYNVQPGITIDYATGISHLNGNDDGFGISDEFYQNDYILNTKTMKMHLPSCEVADKILSANRQDVHTTKSELINQGYAPCKNCNP